MFLSGGHAWNTGAYLQLNGGARSVDPGVFTLQACKTDGIFYRLIGSSDGTLTWGTKNVAMYEDTIPRSGGNVLTGNAYRRSVDDNLVALYGGTAWDNSAYISLSSTTRSGDLAGCFLLQATTSSSSYKRLIGYPDGNLVWANNIVISADSIKRTDHFWFNAFLGGNEMMAGGRVLVYGYSHSSYGGWVRLSPTLSSSSFKEMNIRPDGTWTWNGTACQITSDQRLKQQITEIDDKLLDAWKDVELSQFKYNDAVEEKGDNARLHTGYVVQQIDAACKSHNVDISDYGLYCHEEYPEETEEVEVEQDDGTKTKETKVIREASEHYSLRYTEVYAVECAYLRREINKLKEELKQLKAK